MITNDARWLTIVAALGAGLSAGVYLAFSSFVMPALRRQPPGAAISSMQSINRAAPGSAVLMVLLFGTAILCVLLVIAGLRRHDVAGIWQITGAALYLVSVVILVFYHVPHNDQLLTVDPRDPQAASIWSHWYAGWMAWNHARTLAAAGGAAGLILAIRA